MKKKLVLLSAPLFSAVLASACCLLPWVALALGWGSFASASYFESLRPLFILSTLLLLGVAGYALLRSPASDCQSCIPITDKERARSRIGLRAMLMLVALGSVLLLSFPLLSAYRRSSTSIDSRAGLPAASRLMNVRIAIEGLTCPACAKGIQSTLERLDGVNRVEVDFESGLASVSYEASKSDPAQVIEAIRRLGFTVNTPAVGKDSEE